MTLNKALENKIKKLQINEQNLQNYLVQRQQLQNELIEIDSALSEISQSNDSYYIIGNLMVKKAPDEIKEILSKKRSNIKIRIDAIRKNEDVIKKESKRLQEEIIKSNA